MKAVVFLVLASALAGFSRHEDERIDGIWMGYYRTDEVKEKVIVKFGSEAQMEFYTGGVDEVNKCIGSYKLTPDSILFTYKNVEGQEFVMRGAINSRKTYVDGIWKSQEDLAGSFYLEKQDVEERIVMP